MNIISWTGRMKYTFFRFSVAFSCLVLSSCVNADEGYHPSPSLLEKAGEVPAGKSVLFGNATGVFVSPTLILANRHLYQSFPGGKCEVVRAASADGTLKAADLDLVAFPVRDKVDLALLRLKSGEYPAAKVVLHPFGNPAVNAHQSNADLLVYPYRDRWAPAVDMTIGKVPILALFTFSKAVPELEFKVDEDGTIETRLPQSEGSPAERAETNDYERLVYSSDHVYPGASGSPIVDKSGRLIGLVSAGSKIDYPGMPPLNFAVSASDIAKFLKSHGVPVEVDPTADGTGSQAPDISRNVVRLFCF